VPATSPEAAAVRGVFLAGNLNENIKKNWARKEKWHDKKLK
jgi:hypothetical protein